MLIRFVAFVIARVLLPTQLHRRKLVLIVIVILMIAASVGARNWLRAGGGAQQIVAGSSYSSAQVASSRKGILNARLSIEPAANRVRRRLGKRFLSEGETTTEIVARLAIGTRQTPVRIIRSFGESGETVVIDQGAGSPTLSWSDAGGAASDGTLATGELRAQIERLALDTPDQFVLSKLRGTAYQTIARDVRPAEAGAGSDYKGPVWDLFQVGEPSSFAGRAPLSAWRQYYINASTGLIDRVLSMESGQVITAELTDWKEQGGETFPGRIVWIREKQNLMDLTINAINFKSKL